MLYTYQCKAGLVGVRGGGGGGRAWGGDLIAFVGPRVGNLTDLVYPGEGIFESSFTRRGRDVCLPTRTKVAETEHVFPRFHASRTRRMGRKDLESHGSQREQAKGEWISLY